MAVDPWPTTLPHCFINDSHQEGLSDGLLRSEMDTGPAKVRRRSSAVPRPLAGVLRMTSEEIAVLRAFYDQTLLGGSLAFTFPSQMVGSPNLVRFTSPPMWNRVTSRRWDVQISLEVLP